MKRLSLYLVLIALFVTASARAQTAVKRLTVELVSQSGAIVSPNISRLEWRPGADEITYIRTKGSGAGAASALYLYDVASGRERVLLKPEGAAGLSLSSYQWSPKGDAILFEGGNDLWLYEIERGRARRLTDDHDLEEDADFSPTGDSVAFVRNNDLYALELKTGALKRLTYDGSETVLNGKLDWVYEEELANRATGRAYQWSPDGKKIAYLRLDDGPVPKYPITAYLSTHVGLFEQRFPQAGDSNPKPSFHVVAVEEGKRQDWAYPLPSPGAEYLGPSFSWTPDSSAVAFLTLNRHQDELTVRAWEPESGSDRVLVSEKDPYWINALDAPYFLKDGKQFLWLSERDGWLHLYRFGRDGNPVKKLTEGNWMIDHPVFTDVPMFQVDESGGWVYFSATHPDPRERQLYRVRLDGSGFARLSQQPGTHVSDLASSGHYLIDTFSDINTPPVLRLLKPDGAPVATLDQPENRLGEYTLGKTEFVEVKARDGSTLYARLAKPADFSPKKKYPVIVYVYGGPHEQLVKNQWRASSLLDQLFAQEGFLVWTLDNRGSWGRGHAWESVIFKDMGRRELEDQLAGIDYLKTLPYVDAGRLGIWGWSYGGYMTLYALTHAPEVFKCGAAGGPVTHWKFYDSIYTERYMRAPAENAEGYMSASPLEAAAKLRAKLLLIHGADDDNVHMQNTLNFIDALVDAGRAFELYVQPGQKHGFRGDTVETYLNRRLLDFFKRNL